MPNRNEISLKKNQIDLIYLIIPFSHVLLCIMTSKICSQITLKQLLVLLFSCLSRCVSALLFVCGQEYLYASGSGIWDYSTSRQFLGQIAIWATNVEEGKNVYCTVELAHASTAKDCARGHCAGKQSKRSYTPSILNDLSLDLRTHVGVHREKELKLFCKSNGKIWVGNFNISMILYTWNVTFCLFSIKVISISFCNTKHYFSTCKYSNIFHIPSWSGAVVF